MFAVSPGTSTIGKFKETIDIGDSAMDVEGIIRILGNMRPHWMGPDYDIMKKNCVSFSDALVHLIAPGITLPGYTTQMVSIASSFSNPDPVQRRESANGSSDLVEMWEEAFRLMRANYSLEISPPENPILLVSGEVKHPSSTILNGGGREKPSETLRICYETYVRIRNRNKLKYSQNYTIKNLLS